MPCRGTLMRRIRTAMVCSTRRRSSACGAVPHGKGGAVNTARETTPTRWELQYDRAADDTLVVRLAGSWKIQAELPAAAAGQQQVDAPPPGRRLALDTHHLTALGIG